jgi:DNA-binding transcriptional LysR family regulator
MRLTEAGRRYFESAEEVLALLSQAGEQALALTKRPCGKLRLTYLVADEMVSSRSTNRHRNVP